jgi:hypothetical protein
MKKRNIFGIITFVVIWSLLIIACNNGEPSQPVYDVEHYQISASTYDLLFNTYGLTTDEDFLNFFKTQPGTTLLDAYRNQSIDDVRRIMQDIYYRDMAVHIDEAHLDEFVGAIKQRVHFVLPYGKDTLGLGVNNYIKREYWFLYIKGK